MPAGLITLSLVPMVAGSARLTQLATGAAVTAENARFFDSPVPVVAHIVGSSVFLVLGALQFAPSLRRRRWHRISGRIVAPAGLVSALSALWMTLFYDMPASVTGPGLAAVRIVLGTAMAAAIVVALVAIRRGDVRTHSAWMTRAYAIGMGAGTQVLVFLPLHTPGRPARATDPYAADDGRLGDQPRHRRDRHPAARQGRTPARRRPDGGERRPPIMRA